MHTYKIVEEKENSLETVIEKSNIKVNFTLQDLETEEKQFEKYQKEFTAQKSVADAKIKNIEDNHPFVKDLSEEQRFTVHMYQENFAMSRVMGQKLEELEKVWTEAKEERKEIEKQIGIAVPLKELNG